MIAYLRGIIRHLDDVSVVLDVHGVGYDVLLPGIQAKILRSHVYRDHPGEGPEGQEAALWIYYHVGERQPKPILIGFHEREDREFFQLLLTVADVGPTIAARSMTMPVCDYASAIERRDTRILGTLPGIGKRKAEQIVASLKGKALKYALLPKPEIEDVPELAAESFVADAEAVLEGLGYKHAEAVRMVEAARERRPDLADAQSLLEEIWRGERPG
jgi:Holliday junction DNA helicase RuvA